MNIREKIKAWLVKLITPKIYHRLHRKFKKRQLWAFSQSAVSRGLAAGLLFAFIPLPIQIVPAVLLAFLINGNVLIAAGAVFLSNPFTFIPINYFILDIGSHVMGTHVTVPPIEDMSLKVNHWINDINVLKPWLDLVAKEYLIGLLIFSVVSSAVGFILVNLIWIFFSKVVHFRHKRR